jgi:hypothetical protein
LAYLCVLGAAVYVAFSKLKRSKDTFEKSVIISLVAALVASVIYLITYYPPLGNQGSVMLCFLIYACLDGMRIQESV